MSFLGGIVKSLVNPMSLMQLAMGPAGWASLAMKSILSAVGQQVIQQLGQKLGLPPAMIGAAQSAFGAAMGGGLTKESVGEAIGNFAQKGGLSSTDRGMIDRNADIAIKSILKKMTAEAEKMIAEAKEKKGDKKPSVAQDLNIKGGFLVALAEALGRVMDQKSDDIVKLANQINQDGQKNVGKDLKAGDSNAEASRLQQQTSLLQGLSQELSTLSQALSTSLKSIGEGQQTLARKS
jgi:hypothetical protein